MFPVFAEPELRKIHTAALSCPCLQGHDSVEFKHLQTLKYRLLDGFLLFQIAHTGFHAVYDYEYDVVPNSAKSLLQHSIARGHQSVSAATSNTLSLCYF